MSAPGAVAVAKKLIDDALDHQLIDWIESIEGEQQHRYLWRPPGSRPLQEGIQAAVVLAR